jgi:hypothetical protein
MHSARILRKKQAWQYRGYLAYFRSARSAANPRATECALSRNSRVAREESVLDCVGLEYFTVLCPAFMVEHAFRGQAIRRSVGHG